MTTMSAPLCFWCEHYQRDSGGRCAAYPDGIPAEIYHTQETLHLTERGDESDGLTFRLLDPDAQTRVFGRVVPLAPDHQAALDQRDAS